MLSGAFSSLDRPFCQTQPLPAEGLAKEVAHQLGGFGAHTRQDVLKQDECRTLALTV